MKKQIFDLGWEFSEAVNILARASVQWEKVNLPHDVSITRPRSAGYPTGGAGGYAWSGVLTYRKRFSAPQAWQGQRVQLEFEGVYMNAEVSINQQLVALHPYGYTSFLVDITPHLKFGEENELTVVVNNSAQPNSRWYSGTGIYRHVWLRTGPQTSIRPWGVFVTTPIVNPAASTVQVNTEIFGEAPSVLRTTILDAEGAVIAIDEKSVTCEIVQQTLTVKNAQLWSVDAPYLYTLRSELLVDGLATDSEITTFGIRSFSVDVKNGFRLNGVPMKLKGGCVHHDNGLLGAASYDRAEERKIELMKASGYNAIRCAHNPPAPAMLDACDRLGMLVIDETFDCWRMGKNPNDYHLYFEDWWQRDTESMVKRDRNHPSIIIWSIGNEVAERAGVSDGAAWARRQADYVRSLDPTRLVTSALPFLFEAIFAELEKKAETLTDAQSLFDPSRLTPKDPATDTWGNLTREFNQAFDVVGYNYLYARYDFDGKHFPNRVIAGTETFPHQAYEFWKETERLPYVIGDFVWTSLDYLGESGIGRVCVNEDGMTFGSPYPYHLANCGDIDICGFKRPQSYYRDILWGNRQKPFIAVLPPQYFGQKISFNEWGWEPVQDSWTFPGQEGKLTQVEVYSADDEVELWVNGVSAGRKPAGALHRNRAVFEVMYQPGSLEALGYRNGSTSERTQLTTAGEPTALRMTSDRSAINSEYGDLAYITVEIVDENGNRVPYADEEICVDVIGAGELIAIGAANPTSEELYVGSLRRAFEGRLVAVVRSNGIPGDITIKASTKGLDLCGIQVKALPLTD